MHFSRRRIRQWFMWLCLGLVIGLMVSLSSCDRPAAQSGTRTRLTIGLVSYDTGAASVERYTPFRQYLEEALAATVELEPVFNELRAVEQIESQAWDLVFAPAGLAAIAIGEAQYVPLFPLQGTPNQRSVIVAKADSSAESLNDLANTVIALGEPGSATGYYLPLYDLYGLTLAEIRFAPTPKTALEWVADNVVLAGALSEENFQQYRNNFEGTQFRVLHQSRVISGGAVLLSPKVERNLQRLIEEAMQAAPANVASDADYVANATAPDYGQLMQFVEKVRPLEDKVRETPAVLTLESAPEGTAES